jgi:hypothetical protein
MKQSKNYIKEASQKIWGGKNKLNPPFNIGDKIRQTWRLNEYDELESGTEEYKFVGMTHDVIMLLEVLNKAAAFCEDTLNPIIISKNKELGIWDDANPLIGQILQLHFCYADRFAVI